VKPLTSRPIAANGVSDIHKNAGRDIRMFATGMLIVMAIVYFGSRSFEDVHRAVGFVRAFAEAAMVGGLADWFAVTALFRHPMGLPIPHTAIIPRNKDRIGAALANFLRHNFLVPSIVARRMYRMDVASAVGRFLKAPSGGGSRLRLGASRVVGDFIGSLDQERLGGMFQGAVRKQAQKLDIATPMGQVIEAMMAEGRQGPIIDGLIKWAFHTLDANEEIIRNMVSQRANAILRWTGLDERLANEVIDGMYKLLAEMAADPAHPLRTRTEQTVLQYAYELRHDPETREKLDHWKRELIDNPAVGQWIEGIWDQARQSLLRAARDPKAALAGQLGEALVQLGTSLQDDAALNRQINRFARRTVVGVVSSYGDNIVTLVSDTIRGWNAETITSRVENAVGRDLQYIRINGTLVGGLVGLALHGAEVWF
jgi:uncharacterized membrane-anchored protein YjiN (DUF445 family)